MVRIIVKHYRTNILLKNLSKLDEEMMAFFKYFFSEEIGLFEVNQMAFNFIFFFNSSIAYLNLEFVSIISLTDCKA